MKPASDLLDSNRLGLQKIRRAEAAHGSLQAPDLKVTLELACAEYRNGTQALEPAGPFESYTWRRTHLIDRSRSFESIYTRNEFAGFVFEDEFVARGGVTERFDFPTRTRERAAIAPAVYHLLPQRYIAAALRSPLSVRLQGLVVLESRSTSRVDMVDEAATHSLYIDEETGRLARVDVLRHANPYGDTLRTYAFAGARSVGGLTLPEAVTVTTTDNVIGAVRNVFMIDARVGADGATRSAAGAFDGVERARRPASVRALAPDVYLIENLTNSTEQWSYNVLFAEFADHVLVAEAPLDDATTQGVVARVAEVIPGKPIRYLVQSHHHDDHLGGIRGYMALGTRIVVSPGNVETIRRIAEAPFTARPDSLAKNPRRPEFEVVSTEGLILKDARNEAHVYDVGPTAHAREMLVVHFPASRVLFQSDLINAGEFPGGERAGLLSRRVRELRLRVTTMAGAHGETVTGAALARVLALEQD